MPLNKSATSKAFSQNVKAEMKSGKPQKQSLAIAYSVKRHARKMAKGGEVEPLKYAGIIPYHNDKENEMNDVEETMPHIDHERPDHEALSDAEPKDTGFLDSQMAPEPEEHEEEMVEDKPSLQSLMDKHMKKRMRGY